MKPILCLDFDGVMHSYSSKWQGATVIPDPVVPGTFEFLLQAMKHFNIHVFSSRSHQEGGLQAMRWYLHSRYCEWLDSHQHADDQLSPATFIEALSFPLNKPPAFISIDDRSLLFTGVWPDPVELLDFKPWNKKGT